MSKHQKQVMVLALAAVVVVVAGGTQAWADPIRYDNPAGPGHFDWRALSSGDDIYLNILADAASQTGASGSGTFRQRCYEPAQTDIRRGGPSGEGPQLAFAPSGSSSNIFVVSAGDDIPTPGADGFASSSYIYNSSPQPGDPFTLFAAGEEAYVGVRFGEVGDTDVFQYGWIGVIPEWNTVDVGGVPTDTLVLDAFAWGYETEAGVPIEAGVPEPGTLALLAMGAVGVLSRRRR